MSYAGECRRREREARAYARRIREDGERTQRGWDRYGHECEREIREAQAIYNAEHRQIDQRIIDSQMSPAAARYKIDCLKIIDPTFAFMSGAFGAVCLNTLGAASFVAYKLCVESDFNPSNTQVNLGIVISTALGIGLGCTIYKKLAPCRNRISELEQFIRDKSAEESKKQ